MNREMPMLGTWSVIEVTSTIVAATTMRNVASRRPGVGASSARNDTSHGGRLPLAESRFSVAAAAFTGFYR